MATWRIESKANSVFWLQKNQAVGAAGGRQGCFLKGTKMAEKITRIYMVMHKEAQSLALIDVLQNYCFLTKKEAEAFQAAQRDARECEIIEAAVMQYQPAIVTPAVLTLAGV